MYICRVSHKNFIDIEPVATEIWIFSIYLTPEIAYRDFIHKNPIFVNMKISLYQYFR